MFDTFILTMPAMGNVGSLLGLLIYLYAVLGVNLFGKIAITPPFTDVMNFQSFGSSFLILI